MNNENVIDGEVINKDSVTNNTLEQNDIIYNLPKDPDNIIHNYYINNDEKQETSLNGEDLKNKQKLLLVGGSILTLLGVCLILSAVIDKKDSTNNDNKGY